MPAAAVLGMGREEGAPGRRRRHHRLGIPMIRTSSRGRQGGSRVNAAADSTPPEHADSDESSRILDGSLVFESGSGLPG